MAASQSKGLASLGKLTELKQRLLFVIGALIICYNLSMIVRAQPSRAAQPAAVPAE